MKGEEIPISAQVVSIVDVYDALTSERCYKKAFDHDTAIQMILDGQCGQFKVMQEKIDFFKSNSGMNSIDYNAVSGQLTILNGKQQIICQRNDPKYDISNVFEVNREDIRQVSNLLDQTSIQNKEVSLHVMAKVENKRQMCALKLHTLWSPLKKDGYIGIVGYFESI